MRRCTYKHNDERWPNENERYVNIIKVALFRVALYKVTNDY